MSDILQELAAQLPLQVTESEHTGNVLRLAGPNWRLRVSGAWRLLRGSVIESSSGMEGGSDMVGPVNSLVGGQLRAIEYQSRLAPLDIALVMSDGRVLETFGEYYDDWLLTVGDAIIEGPLQSQ